MKILSYKMHEFYTSYKIEYNGKKYLCNYNGGLPKLNGIKLDECTRVYLSDLIEEHFLSNI